MSGPFDAIMSGIGHLCSFIGTDTISAIHAFKLFYGAGKAQLIGASVPATEHSVMCAGGAESEIDTIRRLIAEIYPSGIVSIVSDTWDFWKVLDEYAPLLRKEILAREGKVVFRPDSGDPVKIICGDLAAPEGSCERLGAIRLLDKHFGSTVNSKGYRVLNPKVGLIYGDSITYERAREILRNLTAMGYSTENIVFGIGSYTYQNVTRDTHGFAIKATWVQVNGEHREIFKDPKTDKGGVKKSHRGLLRVDKTDGKYTVVDRLTKEEYFADRGHLLPVMENSNFPVLPIPSISDIRESLHGK
jgi:nicotinamide phosphoribosyltransferase